MPTILVCLFTAAVYIGWLWHELEHAPTDRELWGEETE